MTELPAVNAFDLYELRLFHLVAESGSFTKAARHAGLTQSAVTRQIRGVEIRLGITLFERTTRQVRLTAAGHLLQQRSRSLIAAADATLRDLQREFQLAPQSLRVGIARDIGLAYYPGYFFSFRRTHPTVQLRVVQRAAREILEGIATGDLDVGLLSPPRRLPLGLACTHQFRDEFTLITPPGIALPASLGRASIGTLKKLLRNENWLLIDGECETGAGLRRWFGEHDWHVVPAMEADSFDVITNLVSLGLGVSLVPHRVLALYGDRRRVRRIAIRPGFSRELAVVVRKNRKQPESIAQFIKAVLF
jgi:DNA-binding transcriptional LysR family regulator